MSRVIDVSVLKNPDDSEVRLGVDNSVAKLSANIIVQKLRILFNRHRGFCHVGKMQTADNPAQRSARSVRNCLSDISAHCILCFCIYNFPPLKSGDGTVSHIYSRRL